MLATIVLICSAVSLMSLLILHFVSPEFKQSWRMISEYALGRHAWLITTFFIAWGLASITLALALWPEVNSFWSETGVVLVFISGVGAILGGIFDVKHKHHGLAFGLGIPSLPVGSLLICYHIIDIEKWKSEKATILFSTHAVWISLLCMAVSMILLMSGYKKTGLPMGPGIEPPKELPNGVIGVNGYFNRLLVICYILWLVVIAIALR